MIPLHSLLIYAGIYALAVAVPGPGVIAVAAQALADGFRSALPNIAGTAAGDLVLMTLSVFGLSLVAQAMGSLFFVFKIAGALYLMHLGYRYWTAPVRSTEPASASASHGFLGQLALTVGNPKAIVFFIALLPTAIDVRHLNAVGYLQLVGMTFLVIPVILSCYAAAAARIRNFLMSERARRRVNKTAGAIMMGAGIGVAVS